MTPCVCNKSISRSCSIGRINYRTFSRIINAMETEGASGQSIVRSGTRSRARSPANEWRPNEEFCYREPHSEREFIDEESSLIARQIQFSVFHDGARLTASASSSLFEPPQFCPSAPFATPPQYRISTLSSVTFFLSHLQPVALKTSCKLNLIVRSATIADPVPRTIS